MNLVEEKFVNPGVVRTISGFTLLEFLVVVAILGVLASIAVPLIEPIRSRAERMVCMANLRSLHVSMSAYLSDHKRWPQCPPEATDLEYDNFWIAALESYGITEKSWLCPSIARLTQFESLSESKKQQSSRLHYLPTDFDEKPITPHRFPSHPWFMEIGGSHGNGNLLIRADGGIRELGDLIRESRSRSSNP